MSALDYFNLNEHYQQILSEILERAGNFQDPGVVNMTEFLKQNSTNQTTGVISPKLFENLGLTQKGGDILNSFIGLADQNKRNKYVVGGIDFVEQPAFLIIQNIENGVITAATNKFLITAMQENRTERVQILETFGAPSILWFDEKTKVYNFAGTLLEAMRIEPIVKLTATTEDIIFPWEEPYSYLWGQSFRQLWNEKLRGTKLTENKCQCLLTLMNNVLIGYPATLSLQSNAGTPGAITFQFSFICLKHLVLDTKARNLYDPNTYAAIGNEENKKKILSDYQTGFDDSKASLIDVLDAYYNIRVYGGLTDDQLTDICKNDFNYQVSRYLTSLDSSSAAGFTGQG